MSTIFANTRSLTLRSPAGRRRQRGVALITVMLVFAIAALVVSKILLIQVTDVQRTTGLLERTQAYYYARGAEQLALMLLQDDFKNDIDELGFSRDHPGEAWAQGPVELEIDAIGNVHAQIIDLSSFYNVNNMVDKNGKAIAREVDRFTSMLDALGLNRDLAANLVDYIDADSKEEGVDTEGRAYTELRPGYQVANQPLTDLSELRLVKDFTPDVLETLLPHLSAIRLIDKVSMNVNTATVGALTTLQMSASGTGGSGPRGIGLSRAEAIAELQGREYFDSIGGGLYDGLIFSEHPVASGIESGTSGGGTALDLLVSSHLFEINIRANYAGSVAYLTTVVYEDQSASTGKATYTILERRETDNSAKFISNEKQ